MNRSIIWASLLLVLVCESGFGQQPAAAGKTPHKFRTILTVAGAGGGFVLGVFAGIAAFDDAINSDRKVWTTALISSAGGAVGGYFLGRMLDNQAGSKNAVVMSWSMPDELDRSLRVTQWPVKYRDGSGIPFTRQSTLDATPKSHARE